MFGRRRKIIVGDGPIYLFAPSKDSSDDFLTLTTTSASFHHPGVYLATDARRFWAYLDRLGRGSAIGFFIARCEDGVVVGGININGIVSGGFCSGRLRRYGITSYGGRGYKSACLALVLDQAFTPLDLHRIEENIKPDNEASLDLARGPGFRKEGFSLGYLKSGGAWRDHERWAILAGEWLAAHGAIESGGRVSEVV